MQKTTIKTGILLIITAIILGAFGAHGLKTKIQNQELLKSFETGVKYQIYHGISLLSIGLSFYHKILSRTTFILMLVGVILFSCSIYLLTITQLINNTLPVFIGIITPIGGSLMILAWILVLIKVFRKKEIFKIK